MILSKDIDTCRSKHLNWSDVRAMLHARWRKHRQFELRVDPGMLVDTGTLVCEWQRTGIIPEKEEVERTSIPR